jgi:general secretion pathway protein K
MPKAAARSRGFALLIVLWTLVLIAFVVAQVTAAGRTEIRIAGNLAANAAAQAAADGAIYEAIFHLADPRPEQRWALDGSEHALRIGQSRITLRLEDESGRINPNRASGELLRGLLQAAGNAPENAAELARAITEWVGWASPARDPAVLSAEYRAAGLDYTPPKSPLESIDELERVRGMTPDLLSALRPHLTLFGPAEPNPASADPVVARAIVLAGGLSSGVAPGGASGALNAVPETVLHVSALPRRVRTTPSSFASRSPASPVKDTRCSPGDQ